MAIFEHPYALTGAGLSLALLIAFLIMQGMQVKILSLPARWLTVSAVPLILGLLIGGYIKEFEGFGVRLVSLLNESIPIDDLKSSDVMAVLPGEFKGTMSQLDGIPEEERARVRILTFVSGSDRYDPAIVDAHFGKMPALEYIQVTKTDGSFLCLIPVRTFSSADSSMDEQLQLLVDALREDVVVAQYQSSAIAGSVGSNDSLVDVLPRVRESKYKLLPVVDKNGRYLGIVTERDIEKKISDQVIEAKQTA